MGYSGLNKGRSLDSSEKFCNRCALLLSKTEFYKHKGSKDGLNTQCKKCSHWGRAEPSKFIRECRANTLRQLGISHDELEEIFVRQNGICFICELVSQTYEEFFDPMIRRTLHIDHCHTTGKVRGLLCSKCNRLLGLTQEVLPGAIDRLERAAEYLILFGNTCTLNDRCYYRMSV